MVLPTIHPTKTNSRQSYEPLEKDAFSSSTSYRYHFLGAFVFGLSFTSKKHSLQSEPFQTLLYVTSRFVGAEVDLFGKGKFFAFGR